MTRMCGTWAQQERACGLGQRNILSFPKKSYLYLEGSVYFPLRFPHFSWPFFAPPPPFFLLIPKLGVYSFFVLLTTFFNSSSQFIQT